MTTPDSTAGNGDKNNGFSALALSPQMLANLTQLGYTQMTPIQAACLLYTSPSPRDGLLSRMPSSA